MSTIVVSLKNYVSSSIGRKTLVAISGLALSGFLAAHLLGNFLLFVSPEAFNMYGHKLTSNPLIYVAEAGLILVFLVHLGNATILTIQNRQARPQRYFSKRKTGRGTTFFSQTMPLTGIVLLVFIILHLINFKFGSYYEATAYGETVRDLYRTVVEYFQHPLYAIWYSFAMLCMSMHLSHGLQSSFQSLGLNHPKYKKLIQCLGLGYAWGVGIGFTSIAWFCYYQNLV